jgi:hypothetical protein
MTPYRLRRCDSVILSDHTMAPSKVSSEGDRPSCDFASQRTMGTPGQSRPLWNGVATVKERRYRGSDGFMRKSHQRSANSQRISGRPMNCDYT